MTQPTTVHQFSGKYFTLTVALHEATGEVTVTIGPSEGMQWQRLVWFTLTLTVEEVADLLKFLAPAAALARHVAEGGTVEHWRLV